MLSRILVLLVVSVFPSAFGFSALLPNKLSTTTLNVNLKNIDVSQVADVEISPEEQSFLNKCKVLCEERNLGFENVKNCRDLASPEGSVVKPNKLYRMGRLSDASEKDIQLLMDGLKIKTIVDLRSPTELKDDATLQRKEVFGDFVNVVWQERRRGKEGCLKELGPDDSPVQASSRRPRLSFFRRKSKSAVEVDEDEVDLDAVVELSDDVDDDDDTSLEDMVAALEEEAAELECSEGVEDEECGECDVDSIPAGSARAQDRKERHFVSLMNEFKYVRGTVGRVRKRDIARSILKSPGALVSRRVRSSVKRPFLQKINDGGLPMLNELLLRFGAPGINYVLELCADKNRHPVAFHCTAGKDRTGMITAIILSLLGVPDEAIVEDYSLSANVYAEMNDHKAMVGALSQRNLDAKTFLGAPPDVMRDTLVAIREEYGSVEGYLDWIGFGREKQEQLKEALLN